MCLKPQSEVKNNVMAVQALGHVVGFGQDGASGLHLPEIFSVYVERAECGYRELFSTISRIHNLNCGLVPLSQNSIFWSLQNYIKFFMVLF